MLARCRHHLDEQVNSLSRVQSKFRLYVPTDWLADAGGDAVNQLLQAVPQSDPRMNLKACGQARKMAAERMEELRDLSESIASRHDIPALNPKSWPEGRKLASEEEE